MEKVGSLVAPETVSINDLKAAVYDKVKIMEKTQQEIQQLHAKIAKLEGMNG